MSAARHNPGGQCDECESFCLQRVAVPRKDDGGPAFPVAEFVDHPVHGRVHRSTLGEELSAGMSIRDWFAGQALATVAAYPAEDVATWQAHHFAEHAYALADAMLKARAAS